MKRPSEKRQDKKTTTTQAGNSWFFERRGPSHNPAGRINWSLLIVVLGFLFFFSPNVVASDDIDQLTSSSLVSVAKRILRQAGEIGIAAAGSKIMGSAWLPFEEVMAPLSSELEKRDPDFHLLKDNPGPEARAVAEKAIESISNDKTLQKLLTDAFSALKGGQKQILQELGNIETVLFRIDNNFGDFERDSKSQFTEIMTALQDLRDQSANRTAIQLSDAKSKSFILGKHQFRFYVEAYLSNLQGYGPRWGNTSDSVVYSSTSYDVADADDLMLSTDGGRSAERLTTSKGGIFYPHFSHDDKYIAFITGDAHLRIYDCTKMTTTDVAANVKATRWSPNHFSWSPVQAKIAYSVNEIEGDTQLASVYVYDVEKNNRRKIQGFSDQMYPWLGDIKIIDIYPQWSPDGTRLGLSVGFGGDHDLWIYDYARGGISKVQSLTLQQDFLWLTNTTITFVFGGAGTYRLAKYDISKRKIYYLTRYSSIGYPTISGDRQAVVYGSLSANGETQYELMDIRSIAISTLFSIESPDLLALFPSLDATRRGLVFGYDEEIFFLKLRD